MAAPGREGEGGGAGRFGKVIFRCCLLLLFVPCPFVFGVTVTIDETVAAAAADTVGVAAAAVGGRPLC